MQKITPAQMRLKQCWIDSLHNLMDRDGRVEYNEEAGTENSGKSYPE